MASKNKASKAKASQGKPKASKSKQKQAKASKGKPRQAKASQGKAKPMASKSKPRQGKARYSIQRIQYTHARATKKGLMGKQYGGPTKGSSMIQPKDPSWMFPMDHRRGHRQDNCCLWISPKDKTR